MWCLNLSSLFFSGASTSFLRNGWQAEILWAICNGMICVGKILLSCHAGEHHPPVPSMSQAQVTQEQSWVHWCLYPGVWVPQLCIPLSTAWVFAVQRILMWFLYNYWQLKHICTFRQLKYCTKLMYSQFPSHPSAPQPFWERHCWGWKMWEEIKAGHQNSWGCLRKKKKL